MSYPKQNSLLNQQHSQFRKLGFKENIFILMIFNWTGLSLVIFSFLSSVKSRSISNSLIIFSLLVIGISASVLSIGLQSEFAKFLIVLFFVLLVISFDCYQNKFLQNAVIHLINSGYVGFSFYFLIMELYPGNFPEIWQRMISSAPQAFNMLILCLLFQNVGYYVVCGVFSPIIRGLKNWSNSDKNLINLFFIKNTYQQLFLFSGLIFLGLISRLWNLSLGKIYYTEGSGVPFYISSFLAQFDSLYTVALLYSYATALKSGFKKKEFSYLSFALITFELLYQLLSGSKGRFFSFVIVPISCTYILVRQRISLIAMTIVSSLGFISWLLVYPILVIYRGLLSSKDFTAAINPIETLNKSVQILSFYSWEKYLETILIPLNSSGLAEQVTALTSIIYKQVSQEGILLWQRLFFFWVPRFLWSDKPTALSSNFIGRLSGRLGSEDMTTSVITTSPGELFIYYGFLGSTLMILVGLLLRWFNETISSFKIYTSFRVAVFVTYFSQMQAILGGSFESSLTGIIMQFSILYLILILTKFFAT